MILQWLDWKTVKSHHSDLQHEDLIWLDLESTRKISVELESEVRPTPCRCHDNTQCLGPTLITNCCKSETNKCTIMPFTVRDRETLQIFMVATIILLFKFLWWQQ